MFSSWAELDEDDVKHLDEVFEERIFPVLTPLAVDPGHPFPYISHLSLSLGVLVRDPRSGERRFARVKLPTNLPRFVVMPDGERFVPLEQVIAAHLDQLFPGMEIEGNFAFRVTRNADLTLEEEEADDLLEAVEMELRRRRFRRAVRLEVDRTTSTPRSSRVIQRELDLDDDDVYRLDRPARPRRPLVGARPRPARPEGPVVGAAHAAGVRAPTTTSAPTSSPPSGPATSSSTTPTTASRRRPRSSSARRRATRRCSPSRSRSTAPRATARSCKALIRAAERGKQVAALVELKARGDEQRNIDWARRLEEAGVHVVYGLVGLKTHTKTCLVVRDEPDGHPALLPHRHRQLQLARRPASTRTSGCSPPTPTIGADLTHLFNYLTGYAREVEYRRLLVAPHDLRRRLVELDRAARPRTAPAGRITAEDEQPRRPELIDALYAASQAGVEIDLIVRGMCCLRPGVPGLSETIRVRSIVGRYLEHSRIYCFANGGGPGPPTYLIGSADWMPRNLDRRVEALVPVDDPALQDRLQEILDVNLADDVLAWELGPDGAWRQVRAGRRRHVDTHVRLQELALERNRREPSWRAGGEPRTRDGGEARGLAGLRAARRRRRRATACAPSPADAGDLDATYFDTPDLRLIRAGITLRHRTGEGDGGTGAWTLKLPRRRPATTAPCAGSSCTVPGRPGPVPAELAVDGAPVAADGRPRRRRPPPDLRRAVALVVDDLGRRGAASVDRRRRGVGPRGGRVAARFREVEVEVAAEAPPDAARRRRRPAARRRRRRARPDAEARAGPRARGPCSPPDLDRRRARRRARPAGEVLRAGIAASVLRIVEHDPVIRADEAARGHPPGPGRLPAAPLRPPHLRARCSTRRGPSRCATS